MATALAALVMTFAVARLTRLVAADEITQPLRWWVASHLSVNSMVARFLACRWCVSVWAAVPVAALGWASRAGEGWTGRWWIDVPAVTLALSYATGLLVRLEPGD